jgi:uncharacterized protein (TIGR02145 family)
MKVYLRTNTAGNNITITQNSNNLPTDSTNPLTIIDTASTTTNELKTIEYQACADNGIANGDYSITIAYVLHENYAKVINGANFQDKTTNIDESCSALPTYPDEGSTIVMIDNRNSQEYLVRKLKDNKCWMIDNLKLELTDGMALTSANTDVANDTTVWFTQDGTQGGVPLAGMVGSFTPNGSLTIDNTDSRGTDNDNYNAWRQIDPSVIDSYLNNTGPSGNGNVSYNTNSKTGCGYLYNYYTTTASTVDNTINVGIASGSICPSGWKLPTMLSSSGDFGKLDIAYGGTGGEQTAPAQLTTLWLSMGAWQTAFSGYYDGSNSYNTFKSQGSSGLYWSSSVGASGGGLSRAYYAAFNLGYVSSYYLTRRSGEAVRCLVK